ncbi:succinate dehydrogenase cytochrome b560 subunit, mitochondrial [Musca domestica]|uniref:Succinate dehydrogenase cytochrome b560 subunit, mitochondrial n=1 Tax=Musca domestica TaxID=7370 RepID=A0ABM3VR47_MUSDO|nr:succinate dehydrogenase cytochrome b560 subunit, mitochondrial [Musca domestica]
MCLLSKPLRGKFGKAFIDCLKTQLCPSGKQATGSGSSIRMKIIPASARTAKTYQQKNEDLKRVLSPHLTIYKPQLTSMMSISLRMTGFALGLMTWTVGLTSLLSDHNVDYFVEQLKALQLGEYFWTAARTVMVFPLCFHFVAGIRHLYFDTAKLMKIKQFYRTGYLAMGLSCLLTLALGMWNQLYPVREDEVVEG